MTVLTKACTGRILAMTRGVASAVVAASRPATMRTQR
jgi:hypothetical protein